MSSYFFSTNYPILQASNVSLREGMLSVSKFNSGLPDCEAVVRVFVLPEQALNLKSGMISIPLNLFSPQTVITLKRLSYEE